VLLILLVLTIAIFFCHALVSLCLLAVAPASPPSYVADVAGMGVGPGGYAAPRAPIRVAMARDEEAAGEGGGAKLAPPPAYGLWRENVVCVPSLVFSYPCLPSPFVFSVFFLLLRRDGRAGFWCCGWND